METKGECSDDGINCKRARSEVESLPHSVRRGRGESFKTKLLGSSNPSEWSGFGSANLPVSVEEDDIVYGEGEFGPSLKCL
ncbi:hypothetical protein ACOSQ3_007412 [Xanthoceras sorbifolium]